MALLKAGLFFDQCASRKNIKEIRANLKVCIELRHSVMQIFTKLLEVYRSYKVLVFYKTICGRFVFGERKF